MTPRFVVGSLCYIFYEQQVLLLRRANVPHQGLWTAPGGKMEHSESPHECCIREIQEETSIHIVSPKLCAIQTVVDVDISIHWQLFIFRTTLTKKIIPKHQPDHEEGELRWFALDELADLDRPYTDKQHWAHLMNNQPSLWQGKFV
jgi:8-oxo-dGTP diphosphatase